MPIGTIINTLTVVVGSSIGIFIGAKLPGRMQKISFQAIGLCTLFIGVDMALKQEHLLLVIVAMVLGGVSGEVLKLEKRFESFSEWLKRVLRLRQANFTEGLITAFVLYCIGSMTIVGALEEGLTGNADLLYTKSVLDGISSVFLASVYGVGVLFSALPLFLFQGSITWVAGGLENVLTEFVINQMTGVGGLLIVGLGINLLEMRETKINVTNLLPSLLWVILLSLWMR
ncbi:MAG: DUF554 domain-containing protein [Cytophagales bacterium]|nr:DUF554 domain-containing protein [Cytophagales bacterium]